MLVKSIKRLTELKRRRSNQTRRKLYVNLFIEVPVKEQIFDIELVKFPALFTKIKRRHLIVVILITGEIFFVKSIPSHRVSPPPPQITRRATLKILIRLKFNFIYPFVGKGILGGWQLNDVPSMVGVKSVKFLGHCGLLAGIQYNSMIRSGFSNLTNRS